MAMDIIAKDKKEITWKELPTTVSQDLELLQPELHFHRRKWNAKRMPYENYRFNKFAFDIWWD
jgi:hypothetical protein